MNEQQHLETLTDIKRIMERSTRFMSLSGLGGIGAGVCALVGAYFARKVMYPHGSSFESVAHGGEENMLVIRLLLIAGAVLVSALSLGFFFTWRKAKLQGLPVWDTSARKVFINLIIPLAAGGLFILGLLYNDQLALVAPACLVFYGLALVNASKYTITDIRYLGYVEIVLGILALFNLYNGLLFWALGFGVMHIVYGTLMWWKYERVPAE